MAGKIRVKICGLRSVEEVEAAVSAGADALGFVFYEKSKRFIAPEQAQDLLQKVAPFVQTVGLFVNPDADFVSEVLRICPLDLLQFHGDEKADFCHSFGRKWIKSVPMRNFQSQEETADYCALYPDAAGLLFDAYGDKVMGGSGEVFNWKNIPQIEQAVILAGGLNPENVAEAIAQVKPYAVDVSSGVERNGRKCPDKIARFIEKLRAAQ